jgi:taurine dioxygenase
VSVAVALKSHPFKWVVCDTAEGDEVRNDWLVERLAGSLGAEIHGVDLCVANDRDVDAIRTLLTEHMVLFFPGQTIDIEEHVALGERFGPLEGHPNLDNPFIKHPKVFELAASEGGVADEWHTDLTFMPEPSLMSILHMVSCPSVGGDTMWTNLCAAFEALSPPMRELCEGLSALHDAHPHDHPESMTIHPVVRRHPDTGKKALYVSEHFTRRIVEMSDAESTHLLAYLTRWVQSPQFTVRYRWTAGTVGMWDNRCTQHHVLNDFCEERVIQRVTVMGDKVEGAEPRWQPFINQGRDTAMGRHDRQLGRHLSAVRKGLAR